MGGESFWSFSVGREKKPQSCSTGGSRSGRRGTSRRLTTRTRFMLSTSKAAGIESSKSSDLKTNSLRRIRVELYSGCLTISRVAGSNYMVGHSLRSLVEGYLQLRGGNGGGTIPLVPSAQLLDQVVRRSCKPGMEVVCSSSQSSITRRL